MQKTPDSTHAYDPETAHIHGTVRDAQGVGIGGIIVTVARRVGAEWVGETGQEPTGDDGSYDWSLLPEGTYHVKFFDETHSYVTIYNGGSPTFDTAPDIVVEAGSVHYADAWMERGAHITGKVRSPLGVGLAGVWAQAYQWSFDGWASAKWAYSAADGSYDLGALSSGTYRVEFGSAQYGYRSTFYPNVTTIDTATDITVQAPQTTPGIDGVLGDLPPASLTVNDGALYTASPYVTLRWAGTQGAAEMRFGVNGAWSPWSPYAASCSYTFPAGDGSKTVTGQYRTAFGAESPEAEATVVLDTVGPRCKAQNVTVKRGKTCKLWFDVNDSISPKVTMALYVKTRGGSTKARWSWGYLKTWLRDDWWWYQKYTCRLRRGTYRIEVRGNDLAGNHQSRIGTAKLVVK